MSHRDRLRWSLIAVAALSVFVLVDLAVTRTGAGHDVDEALRNALLNGVPGPVRRALDAFARPFAIVALAPVAVVLALIAIVRRRWRSALAGTVIALAPAFLAFSLRDGDTFIAASDAFPSDHATVAFGLLTAVLVLWPTVVRRTGVLVAALAAIAIGLGNVSWYAHAPSDVAGGALLVLTVAAACFAMLGGDCPNIRWSAGD